jgi:NAD(P)-dependent dehydrogenase (short-subunit alcohol dehydrogenase family)
MLRCDAKVVLVTGAARGIGLASATALAKERAVAWFTDITTSELAARRTQSAIVRTVLHISTDGVIHNPRLFAVATPLLHR